MESLFWISFGILVYTYIGYGLLLLVYNAVFGKRRAKTGEFYPEVTLIVPAYNEAAVIRSKIENSLSLVYPSNKINFLFITDGSTDGTEQIVREYPQVSLLHLRERRGKAAAINRGMKQVTTPYVVFTDANTMLCKDSISLLVRHFLDEKIGGVSGEKRVADKKASAVGFGERLYWQYESKLKKANADFYTIVGAAGELFAIRTKLFRPVNENIVLDDFVISASICQQGYRFLYEENAFAVEASSSSIKEERKRKIRISAGCFQALVLLKSLLNPIRDARITFQYISHRVLRWTLCPLLLPLLFLVNIFLLDWSNNLIYTYSFWLQAGFYLLALIGWAFANQRGVFRPLLVPYYFVFMVLSQYAGFYRYLTNRQTVLWEKAHRQPLPLLENKQKTLPGE